MENKDLYVGIALFALVVLLIIFGVRSATNGAKADAATEMGASLIELLRTDGYTTTYPACRGLDANEFAQLSLCLQAIKDPKELTTIFKEDQFRNYDERTATAGYLVIENAKGAKTFASANFTLTVNNIETMRGCATPDAIAPGYTCKFTIDQKCNPGDNLEIKYDGKRAFLKTC